MNKRVLGLFVLGLFAIVLVSGFASAKVNYCGLGGSESGGKPYCNVDGNLRYIDSCYKSNCNDHLTAAKKACQILWGSSYSGTPTFTEDGSGQTPTGSIKGTVYVNTVSGTTITEYNDCPGCTRRFTSLTCPGCIEGSKYCDASSLHICQKGKDTVYPGGYCSGNKLAVCVAGRVVESNCVAGKNAGKCILPSGASLSNPARCYECDSDGDKVLKKLNVNDPGSEFCRGTDCDDSDSCIKGLKSCDADSDGFINIAAFIKADASSKDNCKSDTTTKPDCDDKNVTIPRGCNLNGNYQKCVDGKCAISCYKDTYTGKEYCCPEKTGGKPFVCDSVVIDFLLVRDSCIQNGCDVMTGQCVPAIPSAKKCVKGHNSVKVQSYTQVDNLQLSHDIIYTCDYCDSFTGCTPKTCTGRCGTLDNGCGGTLNCGSCPSGQTCNAVGQCITPCTPTNCNQLGKTCGTASDGCGRQLNCGSCPYGMTCVNGLCQSSSGSTGSVILGRVISLFGGK